MLDVRRLRTSPVMMLHTFQMAIAATLLPVVASFFSYWRRKAPMNPDQVVLDQLRAAGSDLGKPHLIVHYLYFPSDLLATQAAEQAARLGCNTKVDIAADSKSWLCLATFRMVPVLQAVSQLREGLERVAADNGGEYDGWEAEVS